MNGGKHSRGYTILEVMIVLAVSGIIFLIAANFINGKQAKTSFKSGVTETASRIQDVIDQVNQGRYSDQNFTCIGNTGTPSFPNGAGTQGTNHDCVFLGKFLHFSRAGNAPNYEVFSLAGLRLDSFGKPATTFATAIPTVIKQGGLDLTVQQSIPQSIPVTGMKIIDANSAPNNGYGFGFIQGLGTVDANGDYVSGTQTASLVYAPHLTSALTLPSAASENAAISNINNNQIAYAKSVALCLSDGTRFATVFVGANGDSLRTSVRYRNDGSDCI